MDNNDRALLNIIQTAFPIKSHPYLALAKQVGISEEDAHTRIKHLRNEGVIRRLGGVFDSRRLGYKSTLCAAKVPENKIPLLTELLDEMPGVTHNYLRNHNYNMWFTLIAPTYEHVENALDHLRKLTGLKDIYSLPALKVFKIKVDLDLNSEYTDPNDETSTENQETLYLEKNYKKHSLSEEEINLIRLLQGDLPEGIEPFKKIAVLLNWTIENVIETTQQLIQIGVIRRFGAVLRHQKAGYVANVMGVWRVESDKVEDVGRLMAQFKEVSHCYERPMLPDWQYNLFTMIHGHSNDECKQIIDKISIITGIKNFGLLYSLKELKKSSMKYFLEGEEKLRRVSNNNDIYK